MINKNINNKKANKKLRVNTFLPVQKFKEQTNKTRKHVLTSFFFFLLELEGVKVKAEHTEAGGHRHEAAF